MSSGILKILDAITCLCFESSLPSSISGSTRCELVSGYRKWKGANHVPKDVHRAIRWKASDPFLEDDGEDLPWKIVSDEPEELTKDQSKDEETSFVPAMPKKIKRKCDDDDADDLVQEYAKGPPTKKQKIACSESPCLGL